MAFTLILILSMAFALARGMSGRSFLARRLVLGGEGVGFTYLVVGNPVDVATRTRPGLVLGGGGADIDESFRWLIERSGGGDIVIIRTTGTDAYNDYLYDMKTQNGIQADSVATLIVTSRAGSFDPFVARTIRSAEALWIAGGTRRCTTPDGGALR